MRLLIPKGLAGSAARITRKPRPFLKTPNQSVQNNSWLYFPHRKSEQQIAPAKSQVQGHYVRDSGSLPYTHFRREPDRDFLRQVEYYESDDYLPPAPAPAPAQKRTERVPRSSQLVHDGNEYSTPPDSDR